MKKRALRKTTCKKKDHRGNKDSMKKGWHLEARGSDTEDDLNTPPWALFFPLHLIPSCANVNVSNVTTFNATAFCATAFYTIASSAITCCATSYATNFLYATVFLHYRLLRYRLLRSTLLTIPTPSPLGSLPHTPLTPPFLTP